jgi:large subunit ribosomal protein L25
VFLVFIYLRRNKMSDEFVLKAEPRTDVGKGASRRLRRLSDLVPAIIYGAGKDAATVTFPHKELHRVLENEAFYSTIITIKTGRKKDQVILKDLQRHPAKDRIMHADFLRIKMDQKITISVPIHFINEEDCVGVKQDGGEISHTLTEIEISCLPGDLPGFIEVDMLNIAMGGAVHMSDVITPEGVDIVALQQVDRLDQTVASVHAMRAEEIEEVLEAELEEGEIAEEGEEAQEDQEGQEGQEPEEPAGDE